MDDRTQLTWETVETICVLAHVEKGDEYLAEQRATRVEGQANEGRPLGTGNG